MDRCKKSSLDVSFRGTAALLENNCPDLFSTRQNLDFLPTPSNMGINNYQKIGRVDESSTSENFERRNEIITFFSEVQTA